MTASTSQTQKIEFCFLVLQYAQQANVAFLPDAHTSTGLATLLAEEGIAVSPSHFDGWRLLEKMGIDPNDGVLRISFAHYNTQKETLRLIAALESILGS